MDRILKNPIVALFWLLILGGFINYLLNLSTIEESSVQQMKEAFVQYVKGEKAGALEERSKAFNQALKLYLILEKEHQPNFGNGILDYNIANSFFQLEEYPMAILHYKRALLLMPRDEKAAHNLAVALEKLAVKETKKNSIFEKLFFFYSYFSLPEKLQGFFVCSFISLVSAFLFIWYRKKGTKRVAVLFASIAFILLVCFGYHQYIEPSQGVIVRATSLYRDAGYQYSKVQSEPILTGKTVTIVDVKEAGEWLKIVTSEGVFGYIPSQSVRII